MRRFRKGKGEHSQERSQRKGFLILLGGTFLVEHVHFLEFLGKENKMSFFCMKVKLLTTQLTQIGGLSNYHNKNYLDLIMKLNYN